MFFDFAANKFAVERQTAGGRAFCWLRLTQGKMGDFKSFGRLRLGLRADSNGPFGIQKNEPDHSALERRAEWLEWGNICDVVSYVQLGLERC